MAGKKSYDLDLWELGAEVTKLKATGLKARNIAKAIMHRVEAACAKLSMAVPTMNALTVKIDRYTETDPADRRTKQARAQGAMVKAADEAATHFVRAQVDAAQILQKYVDRVDAEVTRLEQMMDKDPITDRPVAPDFAKYFTALTSLSREMRGWITLLVDIKDRVWQHEQYERALTAILVAIQAECPPEVIEAVMRRLQSDPAVSSFLGGQR